MIFVSLFDGMSCGRIALKKAGVPVTKYYASEIDKYAQIVSKANFDDITYIGDVRNVNPDELGWVDALIGGSPCQSFSFAGERNGMSTKTEIEILTLDQYLQLKNEGFEFEGQSYLFWEYIRILTALRKKNPKIIFLLENVMMAAKWQRVITQAIGINPIEINSALVSAQNRERLYWTNIHASADGFFGDLYCKIPQPKDKGLFLRDILEKDVPEKYYLKESALKSTMEHYKRQKEKGNGFSLIIRNEDEKSGSLTTGSFKSTSTFIAERIRKNYKTGDEKANTFLSTSWKGAQANGMTVVGETKLRRLTPLESERLQTVPDNYTNHVSDTQRYRMIGNGWTIDVIAHIFSYLK